MTETKKYSWLVKLEILLPILYLLMHLIYYKAAAHVAASEGENFNYLIDTRLDNIIPVWPLFTIPYIFVALLNPLIAIYYLIKAKGYVQGLFRRLYISLLILAVIPYAIWMAFPVKDPSTYANYPSFQSTVLGRFMLFIHNSIPLWNSFPSFHVLLPWFLYRVVRYHAKQYAWMFWWMWILIVVATVTIKVHYVADVLSAWLIAELIYRFVFLKLEKNHVFEKSTTGRFLTFYGITLSVLTLGAVIMIMRHFIVF